MIDLIGDLLTMFTVLVIASLCGLGFFRLFGMQDFRHRLILAPALAIAVSGILVAMVVIGGIPIGKASPFIWGVWVFLALIGVTCFRSAWISSDYSQIINISGLVTLFVTAGYFRYGLLDYLGSPALDGWSYVSFGEYLRQYPKTTEGGLAPIHQYASHLSGTRFVASAMLAVFIPPWNLSIDTQMMVGPLLILSIFSYSLSLGYVASIINKRGMTVPVYLVISIGVLGGWIQLALIANNYDNLMVLSMSPALFGVVLDLRLNRRSKIILPSILMAASFYIYPELFPLILFTYFIAWVGNFFQYNEQLNNLNNRRSQFLDLLGIALVTLIIITPYLNEATSFFHQQLTITSQATGRPGEGLVPSLLDGAFVVGAIWGLGGSGISIILGLFLGQISLVGLVKALNSRIISLLLYLLTIFILFFIMVFVKNYDYGAYKIILLGWWAISIILSAGTLTMWKFTLIRNPFQAKIFQYTAALILFICIVLWIGYSYKKIHENNYKTVIAFREARDAVFITKSAVQVSVRDTTHNAWLVYQLRDSKALFTEFHGYMNQSHTQPLMARSMVPNRSEIKYILTDINSVNSGKIIWKNNLFKLCEL